MPKTGHIRPQHIICKGYTMIEKVYVRYTMMRAYICWVVCEKTEECRLLYCDTFLIVLFNFQLIQKVSNVIVSDLVI
jgi:hypothetical protein